MWAPSITSDRLEDFYGGDPFLLKLGHELTERARSPRPDTLGVLLLKYDAAPALMDHFIQSLLGSDHGLRTRLYIVNNTDPSGSDAVQIRSRSVLSAQQIDRLRRDTRFEAVRVLGGVGNLGFRAGHNLALSEAIRDGCEWVLLVNDDGALHCNTIRTLHELIDQPCWPRTACASPAIYFGAECPESPDLLTKLNSNLLQVANKYVHDEAALGLIHAIPNQPRAYAKRRFPLECCVLMTSRVAALVGLLDTAPFIYFEGHEFGSKLFSAGGEMLYTTDGAYFHPRNIFDYKEDCFKAALLWRAYFTILARQYRRPFSEYFSIYTKPSNVEFNAFNPNSIFDELTQWCKRSSRDFLFVMKGMADGLLGAVQQRAINDYWDATQFRQHWQRQIERRATTSWNDTAQQLIHDQVPHRVTWLLLSGRAPEGMARQLHVRDVAPRTAEDLCNCFAENAERFGRLCVKFEGRGSGSSFTWESCLAFQRDKLRTELKEIGL